MTPLHQILFTHYEKGSALVLMEHGADIHIKSKVGTCFEYTEPNASEYVVVFIHDN